MAERKRGGGFKIEWQVWGLPSLSPLGRKILKVLFAFLLLILFVRLLGLDLADALVLVKSLLVGLLA